MAAQLVDVEERPEAFYRFSVKCDRATCARIDAAARRAGVSATTFVQRHFETILTAPVPAKKPAGPFDARAFAQANSISVTAARLWWWLTAASDQGGVINIRLRQMAEAVGGSTETYVAKYRDELIAAELLEVLRSNNGRTGMTYRVLGAR